MHMTYKFHSVMQLIFRLYRYIIMHNLPVKYDDKGIRASANSFRMYLAYIHCSLNNL